MTELKHFHVKQGKEFQVKELFKDVARMIKKHFGNKTEDISMLDVGGASGELMYFLRNNLKTNAKVVCLDLSEDLVKNAKERFANSNIDFFVANALDFKLKDQFDVITMTSVLSHFDDPYPVIQNMLDHLKPMGILIISGIFNSWNIEVRTLFRPEGIDKWHTGMNQFGIKNIQNYLGHKGFKSEVTEQIMPFDIEPKEHFSRSWTVMANGKRMTTSRLQFLYNIHIFQITRTGEHPVRSDAQP